jgi:hypothetical protein
MDRRSFIRATTAIGGAALFANHRSAGHLSNSNASSLEEPWFDRSMRWAQLAFVENDPGRYDPDFWLDYFKRIHADGALLSAGGIVAFYPTKIPLHYQSPFIGDTDPLGYLVNGCRKMNMSIILRTDPHAVRQNVYDSHSDWIAVDAEGKQRRHWANKELWVTCALGPYNFDFMTSVNKEIMERYQPEAIFSNRWSGHGICYCEHCVKNFKDFSGFELPRIAQSGLSTAMAKGEVKDPSYRQYRIWRTARLKELWFLWDSEIRKQKSAARYIPNGFPDKLITGQHSDFFFADQQARSGVIPPWSNGKHAKELRATMGMKPQVGIFSVGVEEQYRWKDSVQSNAEIRAWVSEGVANGLRPCFVKFGGNIFDKRWMETVEKMYVKYYNIERYLRNTEPVARIGVVYSEQTSTNYGENPWQKNYADHANGIYHALIEDRLPFEMVHDKLMDAEHLKPFKLLILPNIAALSDSQCNQLRKFVEGGGSLLATYETSLYDEEGNPRTEFGLADIFGVSYSQGVEGPMQNSYLRLKADANGKFHPALKDLEDAYRIINSTHRVKVNPKEKFPTPVTLVPTYPDLPMEDVYPRTGDTDTCELYLREVGKGRIAYFPGDIDRTFWQIMSPDHGKLLTNTIRWALHEEPIVEAQSRGVLDVTVWRQQKSMTVHLVNLTNPMMMKGPFRELIPVDATLKVRIPNGVKTTAVKLLLRNEKVTYKIDNGVMSLSVPNIEDHEIVGIDLS